MEAIVLAGGFLFLGAFGFWLMDKLDRFLDSGGFSPYWNEEEQNAAELKKETAGSGAHGAAEPYKDPSTAKK